MQYRAFREAHADYWLIECYEHPVSYFLKNGKYPILFTTKDKAEEHIKKLLNKDKERAEAGKWFYG